MPHAECFDTIIDESLLILLAIDLRTVITIPYIIVFEQLLRSRLLPESHATRSLAMHTGRRATTCLTEFIITQNTTACRLASLQGYYYLLEQVY